MLRFKSDYFESGAGFNMRYESKFGNPLMTYRRGTCGGSFTTPNGVFTSPAYPKNYPDNSECIYTIMRPSRTVILLNFTSLGLDSYSYEGFYCPDYLEIRDGHSAASPFLERLCSSDAFPLIQSRQNSMWIKYV